MYVYFIEAFGQHDLKRIKIGRSRRPRARLEELQTGSPVKLKLLGTVRCKSDGHAKSVERYAHNIFHKQRRRGEWFHLSKKHLAQIKRLIEKVAERELEPSPDPLPEELAIAASLDREFREVIGQ